MSSRQDFCLTLDAGSLGLSGTSEVITLLPGAPFWSPDKRLARTSGSMVGKGLGLKNQDS